jgi:putative sigma-54 modulation protein
MKVDIKGVHYELTEVTREFLEVKLEKLAYAESYIMDLHFTLSHGTGTNDWRAEVKVNFTWGGPHVFMEETAYNLHEAIEKLIDKLDHKVSKEKGKVQDHHHDKLPEVE